MNAAQVRAKARMAMRRKEEAIESDEGGELNLVPYLDIISNVVLFLLASVTTGLVLGTVNSSLPEYSPTAAETAEAQAAPESEPPLQLVVALTRTELRVFSLSGLEGTAAEPKLRLPAQGGAYPYAQLTAAATEIVERRWPGRPPLSPVAGQLTCLRDGGAAPMDACRPDRSTEVFLMVDGDVRYEPVIATMDALRETPGGTPLFPAIIFSSGIR